MPKSIFHDVVAPPLTPGILFDLCCSAKVVSMGSVSELASTLPKGEPFGCDLPSEKRRTEHWWQASKSKAKEKIFSIQEKVAKNGIVLVATDFSSKHQQRRQISEQNYCPRFRVIFSFGAISSAWYPSYAERLSDSDNVSLQDVLAISHTLSVNGRTQYFSPRCVRAWISIPVSYVSVEGARQLWKAKSFLHLSLKAMLVRSSAGCKGVRSLELGSFQTQKHLQKCSTWLQSIFLKNFSPTCNLSLNDRMKKKLNRTLASTPWPKSWNPGSTPCLALPWLQIELLETRTREVVAATLAF